MIEELERYELREAPRYRFDVRRRDFIRMFGGGLVVLLVARDASAQESGRRGRGDEMPEDVGAWLHVGEDGTITVFTGKTEVGQNIRTSLAQPVAEELRIPVSKIRMVMADTERVPYDRGTFGSRSTPQMGAQLRRVAAAAREALIALASSRLGNDLVCADGGIRGQSGDAISFADLTKGRKLVATVQDNVSVTTTREWKVMGTSVPKVDGRDFVTGKHVYTTDHSLPGMVYAKILRPPAFGAKIKAIDISKAAAMEAVKVVQDGNFVGVTAPTPGLAARAVAAIAAEWEFTSQISSAELFKTLRGGDAPEGAVTYTVEYIAHAPLEPRAAVAEWKDGKMTVWTGTQRPFGVRSDVAGALGIPEDAVRVVVPDTGSGYGGKHTGDAAVEAAKLAKATGLPVKLVWTREEEFTWAYFRPAGVIDIASAIDGNGKITSWKCDNYNSGRAALESPYAIPQQNDVHEGRSPLRQGSYRGLASVANVFAREVHMDELAEKAGLDPLEFRMRNLADERIRDVLKAAVEKFGWTPEGKNMGISCGTDKGSVVAACAEVAIEGKTIRVKRVVAAFECGAIVNPDQLHNQVEGGIIMGLGGALSEKIDFADGKILNPRFSAYQVPRFADMPKFDIVLLDRKDRPSAGAGETPIICIAPAIGNAIYRATGQRLRSLPMALS